MIFYVCINIINICSCVYVHVIMCRYLYSDSASWCACVCMCACACVYVSSPNWQGKRVRVTYPGRHGSTA